MTTTKEHFANEAKRLLSDDALATAFETVRMNALLALSTANADDKTEILRLQAKATCLQEVRDELFAAIAAIGEMDGGVSSERTGDDLRS